MAENKKHTEAQGAEVKKRDSISATIKTLKANIERIERNGWLNEEELLQFKKVYGKLVERFISITTEF